MNDSHLALTKKLKKLLTSPLAMRDILAKLAIPQERRSHVRRQIKALVDKGVIVRIRGSRYGLPDRMNLVTGRVSGHPDRFGFLIPDDQDETDIFLGPKNFDLVMNGDRAVVRVEKTRADGKREGVVIRILERAIVSAPGEFHRFRNGGNVTLFDHRVVQDIYIPPEGVNGAKDGQAVMVEITEYPARRNQAFGDVVKILGDPDDPAVEIEIIVAKYNLPSSFPKGVTREAKKIEPPSEKDILGRLDLRGRTIVTIDGETAKDFDDAVEVERLKNGHWRLGVHIADVAHYVREETPIDTEANKRGNSVYFPGSVIPMLPFKLSNDVCSLNPKVDRLTMSCVMTFDERGNLKNHKISNSVIRSTMRMTYTDVAAILDGDQKLKERYSRLVKLFSDMKTLAELLRHRRFLHGAIDFDLPEPEIILDVTGRPENIILAERNIAHRIIEEFMLAANQTVAGHLIKAKYPGLYRVHEPPDPKKMNALEEFLDAFGYRFYPTQKVTSKTLQKILQNFEGRPEEKLVTHVILRSMMRASYSPINSGHFGLAFDRYAHFTSPIRRYPDLIVHRLLKDLIKGARREKKWEDVMEKIANHCSSTERNAEDAEREVVKLRQTQYMKNHVGDQFNGVISGVTSFGFFVELVEPPVEGLVRLTSITDDYYVYSETDHALYGDRTKKRYRLGDSVKIEVVEVSVERRRIDFALVGKPEKSSGQKPSRRGKKEGARPLGKKKKTRKKTSGARQKGKKPDTGKKAPEGGAAKRKRRMKRKPR